MKRRTADKLCSQCSEPGFRYRGERWLCVIHNRIDTMRNSARASGQYVPTNEELACLVKDLISRGMQCESCTRVMQWAGKNGEGTTVSIQHDRSGRIRLICMLCNVRHDDLPEDTFYELPPNSWRCVGCKTVKPLTEFYPNKVGCVCKPCRKELNRKMWSRFGKQWSANSKAKGKR